MHFSPNSKRIGIVSAIGFAMLAMCLIAYNAQSDCEPAAAVHSTDTASSRTGGSVPHTGPGPRPKPWVRMVVTHAISIANKLAAS